MRGLWGTRSFRVFWIASTLSALGTSAYVMALTWLTARFYGAHGIALLALGYGIPQILLELFGGAAADHMRRRKSYALTESSLLLVALLLWLVSTRGVVPLWLLVVVSAGNGIISSLDTPARSALIGEMVRRKDLVTAQQFFSVSSQLANIFGPALGGVLLSVGGGGQANEQAAFLFNVFSYVPVLLSLPLLPGVASSAPVRREKPHVLDVVRGVQEGLNFVRTHRSLVILMQLLAVVMVLGGPFQQLLPIFVRDSSILESSHVAYAVLLTAVGLGGLVGSLLGVALAASRQRFLALSIGALGLGGAILLFTTSQMIHWASLSAFLAGACSIFTVNLDTALLQGMTPLEVQGRVSSIASLGKGLQSLSAAAASAAIELLHGVLGLSHSCGLILALLGGGLMACTLGLWRPLTSLATGAVTPALRLRTTDQVDG